jgi:hypothetical protein
MAIYFLPLRVVGFLKAFFFIVIGGDSGGLLG